MKVLRKSCAFFFKMRNFNLFVWDLANNSWYLSLSADICRSLSIFVDICRYWSICVDICRFLSIFVDICWYLSISVGHRSVNQLCFHSKTSWCKSFLKIWQVHSYFLHFISFKNSIQRGRDGGTWYFERVPASRGLK